MPPLTVAGTFNGWNQAVSSKHAACRGARTWQYDTSFSSLSNFQFKFAANGTWVIQLGRHGSILDHPDFPARPS